MGKKLTVNSNGKIRNIIRLIMAYAALFLFVAGCQEKPVNDDAEVVDVEAVTAETAVPPQATNTPEIESRPEIEGEIVITSSATVSVMAVATTDLAAANIDPLPAGIGLVSDVYAIDTDDTAVSGQVAINVPGDADEALVDLYGWDGASWVFVPSEYDSATQQRYAADQVLFTAVALVQPVAPDAMTVGGVWSEDAVAWSVAFTEAIVGTVYLGADAELEGSLPGMPADVANPYLHLTNVGDTIAAEPLALLLADEAAQTAQVAAIVEMAEAYSGVNLNYQGVAPEQNEAFTAYVRNLSAALDAQDKNLILTLAAPSGLEEESDLDGYNWAELGSVADAVYLQLPLDASGYEEGETADQLLNWATDNINRRKLVALIPASPVVHAEGAWTVLTADQLSHFAELETDAAEYEPETVVEAALSGEVSSVQWDEANSAYYFTVEDSQEVWLVHPATLAYRMETAVRHNLQGVAFTSPTQLPDSAQAEDPTFVWTVLDEDGNVIVSERGLDSSFSWEGAETPGEFTLRVDLISGGNTTSLGTVPITVVAAEETEEVAARDESAETIIGVVKRNANVRIGPGEGYEKFPGPILKDREIEIVGRDEFGYWLYIVFDNIDGQQMGWIATSLVEIDPEFDISLLEDATEIIADAPDDIVAEAPQPPPANDPEPTATPPASAPPSGPPPPVSAPPVAVGGFELGGQTHTFSNPVLMASAGMTWVKFQHKWGEGNNPNDLAGRINNAHAAGFKVLLSIPGANTYPDSINFGEYVQFLAGVAALGPDAIEVWNEMNIDFEWPAGQIDPASYVNNMLAPAYNAIKAANPNVMVISGAPAPTGFDNGTNAWADNRYMAGMLAAGAGSYADCIGAHFNAGASSPSTVSGHPTGSAHYSWYLLPTLNVYAQLGRPVCFTELGYLSGEDYGGVPERFGWAAGTTVDQHAAWLAEAVSVAANTGKVRLIIIFNVDFTHWGDDPQAGYAMIRKNGGCPACGTLARVMGR